MNKPIDEFRDGDVVGLIYLCEDPERLGQAYLIAWVKGRPEEAREYYEEDIAFLKTYREVREMALDLMEV